MQHTRILIADDHPVFIEGLVNILKGYPQYVLAGTANNSREVLENITKQDPHIVLLDVNMPGVNGLELVEKIKKQWPHISIILLTMYMPSDIGVVPTDDFIDGYVLKNSGSQVILDALQEVAAGQKYFDSNIKTSNHHSSDNFSRQLKLSSREKEILQLLTAGQSNKEIADRLFLSELTIRTHRKNIMKKLGAHNLADLVRKGM